MKKIIVCLSVVFMSIALFAVPCTWKLSGLTKQNASDNYSDYTAYLFLDSGTTTYAALSQALNQNDTTAISGILAGALASANPSADPFSSSGTGLVNVKNIGDFKQGDYFDMYSLVFNTDSSYYLLTSVANDLPANANVSANFPLGTAGVTEGWKPLGDSGGDVPEPTSGLLLLVGGALLALRRKQK